MDTRLEKVGETEMRRKSPERKAEEDAKSKKRKEEENHGKRWRRNKIKYIVEEF